MSARTTERLIGLLSSVNATAIDNDDGKPGEFLAELCHEAAQRLRELERDHAIRIEDMRRMIEHDHNVQEFSMPAVDSEAFQDDYIARETFEGSEVGC